MSTYFKIVLFCCLIGGGKLIVAQTTQHFSQMNLMANFLSPSETGREKGLRSTLAYRNQWRNIGIPFTSNLFSSSMPILQEKIGVGVFFLQENLGDNIQKSLNAKINLAYHLKSKLPTQDILSFGISSGIVQFSNNGGNSIWEEQWNGFYFDENIFSEDQNRFDKYTKLNLDFSAGMTWGAVYLNKIKTTAGVSIKHLLKPNYYAIYSENQLNRKLTVYGTVEIREQKNNSVFSNDKPFLTPDFYYTVQGNSSVFQIGSFISFPIKVKSKYTLNGNNVNFKVGSHLRVNDAVIINAAFRYNNYYIGLSYDYTLSNLQSGLGITSAFELLLKYNLGLKR
ncbi:MAG: PorP/SprF family type IX secretion system membrane protein [Flavobacteriales bacterium]|jgi:type IX secretion system PorP/SprF family membrane protein|nr:PorP/SprF family type IX secretion system membrane protein [Flavobacteriales bacterium]